MAADAVMRATLDSSGEQTIGWLEILDRTGKVARRFPVARARLRIGRAYDNDIVLDDPYVCHHHVAITWHEGMLRVEDLDSVNGVFFGPRELRREQELVANDGRFRLGRTVLRFRRHDCPLPATWIDRPRHAPLRQIERPWVLVAVFFAVIIYQSFAFYMSSTASIDHVRMVTEQVALVAVIIAWSALWSFPSRLLMGRWNFLIHCGIASVGIIAQACSEMLLGFVCFMLDADQLLPGLTQASSWLLLTAVLYAHLSYLVAAPAMHLVRWAGGIAVTLAALVTLVQYLESHEYRSSPAYTITVKAPPANLASGKTPQQLLAEFDRLRAEIDIIAREDKKAPVTP